MALQVYQRGRVQRVPFFRKEQANLATRSLNSVFSVEVNLRHQRPGVRKRKEVIDAYYLRTHLVDPSLPRTLAEEKKREKQGKSAEESEASESHTSVKGCKRNDGQRNATGFVIAQLGTTLRILTCAHSIDEVYGGGVHDVNSFFSFDVHCSHQESRILDELNGKPINKQERIVTAAQVVALDTRKDLMVLEIESYNIFYKENIICQHQHPVIRMARYGPEKLEVCILVGWPPQRMSTLSVGQLSFESRTYEAITDLNPKGYNMSLREYTKMEGDDGSSGGLVVDGCCRCTGVYHGVINAKGYAVTAQEVTLFLNTSNMLP